MDTEFDEFAVGWEALADVDADPALDESWAPVYSTQVDEATAGEMAHRLRVIHAGNRLVRNIGLFGRPAKPAWEPLPLPAVAPEPDPEVVIDGQVVDVADLQPVAEVQDQEGTPDGP